MGNAHRRRRLRMNLNKINCCWSQDQQLGNFGTGWAGLPFKNDPTRHAFGVPALPKGEGIIRLRRVSLEDSADKGCKSPVTRIADPGSNRNGAVPALWRGFDLHVEAIGRNTPSVSLTASGSSYMPGQSFGLQGEM